jgi:hypothetical protein
MSGFKFPDGLMVKQNAPISNRNGGHRQPHCKPQSDAFRRRSPWPLHLPNRRVAKIYMPAIKMLYFCDTFWMRRGYILVSQGAWHQGRILIESAGRVAQVKPSILEPGSDQHYLYINPVSVRRF